MLSIAQLHDLRRERELAIDTYNDILTLAKSDYVNDRIIDAARSGLDLPYGSN